MSCARSGAPIVADVAGIRVHDLEVRRTARVAVLGHPPAPETWLTLHGYGQLAERFLGSFAGVAQPGRAIVAPEALSRFYTSRDPSRVGATWMTREAREAEIRDYLGYLDQVVERFASPEGAVDVHGFSQGTATATRWLEHSRRPVDRLVLWGGGIAPEVDLAALQRRRPRLRWHLCVGATDEFVTEAALASETSRLTAAGIPFVLHRFPGGHIVDPETLSGLGASAWAE